jgi:hypothetical protein
MKKLFVSLILSLQLSGIAFAQEKLILSIPGPLPTRDGQGNQTGIITNVNLDLQRQFHTNGAPFTRWELGYHYYNGSSTQGGLQTMYVDLSDKDGTIIVPNALVISVRRDACFYNGGRDFKETGEFALDFTGKGIEKFSIRFDPLTGRQGRC